MMKGTISMIRNLSLFTRRFRPASAFNSISSSSSYSLFSQSLYASTTPCSSRFFSSQNTPAKTPSNPSNSSDDNTQQKQEPIDVEDISNEELKKRVAKLREGDDEAIPSLFEAILKRYLAGKPIEDDQELMKDLLGKRTDSSEDDDDDDDLDYSDLDELSDRNDDK